MGHFLPFYPTKSLKNQNFTKMKQTPGDISILHKCTKNHDHKPYCSLDMAHDRCNFHFIGLFLPFYLTPKLKLSKNRKMPGDIISVYLHIRSNFCFALCKLRSQFWLLQSNNFKCYKNAKQFFSHEWKERRRNHINYKE